jgi:hypothetical protein
MKKYYYEGISDGTRSVVSALIAASLIVFSLFCIANS